MSLTKVTEIKLTLIIRTRVFSGSLTREKKRKEKKQKFRSVSVSTATEHQNEAQNYRGFDRTEEHSGM